jgi:hypothetical protein
MKIIISLIGSPPTPQLMVIYLDDPNNDEELEFLTIGDLLDSPLLTFSLTMIALQNSPRFTRCFISSEKNTGCVNLILSLFLPEMLITIPLALSLFKTGKL